MQTTMPDIAHSADALQTGKLDWPGQSLLDSYKTMLLAEKISIKK